MPEEGASAKAWVEDGREETAQEWAEGDEDGWEETPQEWAEGDEDGGEEQAEGDQDGWEETAQEWAEEDPEEEAWAEDAEEEEEQNDGQEDWPVEAAEGNKTVVEECLPDQEEQWSLADEDSGAAAEEDDPLHAKADVCADKSWEEGTPNAEAADAGDDWEEEGEATEQADAWGEGWDGWEDEKDVRKNWTEEEENLRDDIPVPSRSPTPDGEVLERWPPESTKEKLAAWWSKYHTPKEPSCVCVCVFVFVFVFVCKPLISWNCLSGLLPLA